MDSCKKDRIHLMDELRGFAIFCMVFYHAFFSMAFIFNMDSGLNLLTFFMPIEPYFAGLFILISGVSSELSRSNLKRGIKLLLIAIFISLVTIFLFPDNSILFGVLHMLAICMIIYALAKPLFDIIPTNVGLLSSAILFLFTMNIGNGSLGFFDIFSITLPGSLYTTNFLFPFGFTGPDFFSADYFPLFPWLFLFIFGAFLGRYAKAGEFPRFTYKQRSKFFSWLGRHSLIIYVVHQPIIYAILWIVELLYK